MVKGVGMQRERLKVFTEMGSCARHAFYCNASPMQTEIKSGDFQLSLGLPKACSKCQSQQTRRAAALLRMARSTSHLSGMHLACLGETNGIFMHCSIPYL